VVFNFHGLHHKPFTFSSYDSILVVDHLRTMVHFISCIKVVEDRTMWLTNVRVQLVSNLEEMQRWYKENFDEHRKEQPSFKVGDWVWFQQQHIKTSRPLEKLDHQRLGPFLEKKTTINK
jgi:hypothetical protein